MDVVPIIVQPIDTRTCGVPGVVCTSKGFDAKTATIPLHYVVCVAEKLIVNKKVPFANSVLYSTQNVR